MPWVLSVLAIVALGYGGLCLFYYLFQERLIFIGFRKSDRFQYRFALPHEEEWIERPDGARLHAVLFPAPERRGLLLYFHGHHGSVQRWGRFADRFVDLGYDVLMPDPRGYGKSRGRRSEEALIEDALAWYDHALRLAGAAPVLYGRSLGSALAVPVASQRQTRLLLLETPFANLIDVAWHYLPLLPYRWLLRYTFRNDHSIRKVNCPVHVFHGHRDQVVPYASALRLYAAIPPEVPREMHDFPKGGHNNLHRFPQFKLAQARVLAG
ncbi:MAG: alpha/beta fold hydrolase [Flavobacteriales bacterium]|nr:alpha/beta fold hydrolase [Flavobacteriales bacterium]